MEIEKCINDISIQYPCREELTKQLYQFLGCKEDIYPQAIYLYGHSCTGKTLILKTFLQHISVKHAFINIIECYTSKILFENILDKLNNYKLCRENGYASHTKCESMRDFLRELRTFEYESVVIVLENSERLRDMDHNILPAFLRLQELTKVNVCCILVSQIPYEKYYPKTGLPEIIKIKVSQYTLNELKEILLIDYESAKTFLIYKYSHRIHDPEEREIKIKIIESLDLDFYKNYLYAFLCVFYKACRNLSQLRHLSKECFEKYCEPVLNGTAEQNNSTKLWRNVSETMKNALLTLYSRLDTSNGDNKQSSDALEYSQITFKKMIQTVELPFYAKYLLIAGFLASHNPVKEDKRLFMKNHGKQRKRLQAVNAKAKVSEKMAILQGPKSFTIDRLLAIFHAILDQKITLTCNLMTQISSLVELNFFMFVSGENNVMDGSARLQCTLGIDFITQIGEMVEFNVRQYLYDFI